jgi:Chain length determinant protein
MPLQPFQRAKTMEQDEIYLIDMWRILARHWRWVVAVLVVVLALTFAYAHSARPQWQATGWVQIGQVGAAPQGQDPKAEPLPRVQERMQTRHFQDEVLKSVGVAADSGEGKLYRKSLKLDPQFYANLIKFDVRAYSRQQATELATATVAQLHAIHQSIDAVPLKLAHERLAEIDAGLQTALADRDRLLHDATLQGKDDAASKNVGGAALTGVLLVSKNEAIRDLQQTRGELVYRLSPNFTFETSSPWPIYVPEYQAYPNPVLTWGIGILAGLFLGALAAVARNFTKRRV